MAKVKYGIAEAKAIPYHKIKYTVFSEKGIEISATNSPFLFPNEIIIIPFEIKGYVEIKKNIQNNKAQFKFRR